MKNYNQNNDTWEDLNPVTTDDNVFSDDGSSIKHKLINIENHIDNKDNPHNVSKDEVGLSNVDNIKQASEEEFNVLSDKVSSHLTDYNQFKDTTEDDLENLRDSIDTIELTADKVELDSVNFNANDVLGGMEELFINVSNGKSLLGTTITDIDSDITVPSNPTFQQLMNSMKKINIGKKMANGTASVNPSDAEGEIYYDYPIRVTGLSFKPTIILYIVSGGTNKIDFGFYFENESGRGFKANHRFGLLNSPYIGSGSQLEITDDGFISSLSDSGSIIEWIAFN